MSGAASAAPTANLHVAAETRTTDAAVALVDYAPLAPRVKRVKRVTHVTRVEPAPVVVPPRLIGAFDCGVVEDPSMYGRSSRGSWEIRRTDHSAVPLVRIGKAEEVMSR